jgi:transposase-like protein
MVLEIQEKDNTFRVKWQVNSQGFSTDWIPDTPSNRKSVLVLLRLLRNDKGKRLFTFGELSLLFGGNSRQVASQHMEAFRDCGSDFLDFLTRKRKVDSEVVDAVTIELRKDPLAKLNELQQRVNARLSREDLTLSNIRVALEQIPYAQVRDSINNQLDKGKVHYQEEYLLSEMMRSMSCDVGHKAGIEIPESQGMTISDPTSIRKLITPDISLSSVKDSLKWIVYCMVLYYYGVPLSVLGSWLNVHKTTILRWMIGLCLEVFPLVYKCILERVKANVVYIDEKWLKVRGKWYYWFVVLDAETQLPVLASLLGTTNRWSCRWIGIKLKQIGKIPGAIVTDGLPGYNSLCCLIEGVKHVLCLFHHHQGVTRWLKKRYKEDKDVDTRKPLMKKVFQTRDKRTVKRRLCKLKESSESLGIQEWVEQTESNLPKLLPSVGSVRIPTTTNAIERFFRAFNRFYKVRCGFFSVLSAKRELIFFLLMYLFIRQSESGKAPIEAIMPEVANMPLYRLINDPLGTVLGVENVKKNVKMADFKPQECLVA